MTIVTAESLTTSLDKSCLHASINLFIWLNFQRAFNKNGFRKLKEICINLNKEGLKKLTNYHKIAEIAWQSCSLKMSGQKLEQNKFSFNFHVRPKCNTPFLTI